MPGQSAKSLLVLLLVLLGSARADDSNASNSHGQSSGKRLTITSDGHVRVAQYALEVNEPHRRNEGLILRLPPVDSDVAESSAQDTTHGEQEERESASEDESESESEKEDEGEEESPEEEESGEEGIALEAFLADGFELKSGDDEYSLAVRVLNQVDFKIFVPDDQFPAAQRGLYIPRTRFYFEGRLTEPYEYEISFQRSVEGQVDLLDGNLNVRLLDDRLQFKVGRFLVPYSYAWYDHLEQYFLAPERPLFPLNFGLSRSTGGMIWGEFNHGQVQYAVAGVDGRLTGLADNGTSADAVGYLNWRPLLRSGYPVLRYLNIGGSGSLGTFTERSELVSLRTSLQSSENDEAATAGSAEFLRVEEGVTGIGIRNSVAIHLAWYYQGWTLETEGQISVAGYSRPDRTGPVNVKVAGYHVGLGYLITGEWITGRSDLDPLRPFDPRCGLRSGWGALELYSRYSQLNVGSDVFSEGLADPDLWTNNAYMVDVGFNWYWNRHLKWTFNWQRSIFGSPVLINEVNETFSETNDLFWFRSQVFF